MAYHHSRVIPLAIGFLVLLGCKRESKPVAKLESTESTPLKAEAIKYPELGPSRIIRPGILVQEASVSIGPKPMKVWFYQPEKSTGKLPLVLVPPAGSTLFVGMDLSEGDREEHYPYVKAGFAVASFEISGHVPNIQKAGDAAIAKGAREFRDAQAGIVNTKTTIDFLLAKGINIDRDSIFIAGHSSAATLALLASAHEDRIKACAAYAPATDVDKRLAPALPMLEQIIPGYKDFIHFSSPKTHVEKLKTPVFLFHAQDDSNIPIKDTRDFATLLKKTNSNVTLRTHPNGGHYDSMIKVGLPAGIEWFRGIQKSKS